MIYQNKFKITKWNKEIYIYETRNINIRQDFEWIMTKLNRNEGENMYEIFMRMIIKIKMILFTIYILKSFIKIQNKSIIEMYA